MVLFIAAARNDADNARYLNGEVLQRNLSTSVQPSSIFPTSRHSFRSSAIVTNGVLPYLPVGTVVPLLLVVRLRIIWLIIPTA